MSVPPAAKPHPTPTGSLDPGALIEIEGARLGYGDRVVLVGVNLRVGAGEFWFLLGPNGSGKSTLLKAILGGLAPQAGSIRRAVAVSRAANIGFVPQRCDLNPSLPTTVREFVSLGLVGIGDARRTGGERMSWALERSGLTGMGRRDYWSLSGGQRQRALLARALIRRPKLFVVDEPTTGLDPRSQDLLMGALADLNRTSGQTILFVTHDLPLAARYASHVALFVDGTVVAGQRDAVLRPESLRRAYGLPIELHTEAGGSPRDPDRGCGVIHDFLSSWSLFGDTYMVGWLVAGMLGLIGVLVVARNQIFVGAALSQASTLGIAVAMWAGSMLGAAAPSWVESDAFLTGAAITVSVISGLLMTRTGTGRSESREAVTGWLFLLGASGAIVVVSHSPHGLEEVQRLVSSSIIGATRLDLAVFSLMTLATAVTVRVWWRPMLLWVMDPATAAAAGVRVRLLETVAAIWLGLAVGLCIRASGMLYTFGCLVLPAMAAKSLCREVRSMFIVSPIVGMTAGLIGFVLANHYDFPPGQLTIALLGVFLPVAWGVRRARR